MDLDRSKTILVSHPRSGLNWLRYCIEFFSHQRTPGLARLQSTGEPIIYRTHDVRKTEGPDSCDCMFYEEGRHSRVVRQAMGLVGHRFQPIFSRMILVLRDYKENAVRSQWSLSRYMSNVLAYDRFDGEKQVIYYEDLRNDMWPVKKILEFLEIEFDLSSFDEEKHRAASLNLYDVRGIGRSPALPKLSADKQRTIEKYLKRKLGDGFERNLGRYVERS